VIRFHAQLGAGFAIRNQRFRPGDDTQRVVGFLVLWIDRNQLGIPLVGLVELLLVEQQRSNRRDSERVLGVLIQNLLELVAGGGGHLHVFRRICARNILLHVGRGQVQPRRVERGVQFHGGLELFDRGRILRALESLHALIQLVTRFQFLATG